MNDREIEQIASVVANKVLEGMPAESAEHRAMVDAHERILKGKNGDIGLVARVFNLERLQKFIIGIFALIGVYVMNDIVARVWTFIHTLP